MKIEAFQGLVVSRALFDQVDVLVYADNKYSSSAALVILQDAFELILKCALIELGHDEKKNIENASFDELIADLKKAGVEVPKTGTLKAMNKERVSVKHYGQIAEHDTVKNFVSATILATEKIMSSVFKTELSQVFPGGQLVNEEIREFIAEALKYISEKDGFNALIAIRKAIFVAIEEDYDISAFADPKQDPNDWNILLKSRGSSAPWHARNFGFVEKNVREPFDYIQLNYEKLRMDLMEWGVNTQDFWNVWRLTPRVYRKEGEKFFLYETLRTDEPELNLRNAKFCLDRAISILQKKQMHRQNSRMLPYSGYFEIEVGTEAVCYGKADQNSENVGKILAGSKVQFEKYLLGFDGEAYVKLAPDFKSKDFMPSYILASAIKKAS